MDEDGRSEVTPEEQQAGAVCWRSTSSWLPEDARFGVPQRFHCAGEFPWCISMTHWRCQLIHLCDTTLLFLAVLREHPLFSPPVRGTILTAALANRTKRGTETQECRFSPALPLVLLSVFPGPRCNSAPCRHPLAIRPYLHACFPSWEGESAGSGLWICTVILAP